MGIKSWFARRWLDGFERQRSYDTSFMREVFDEAGVDAIAPLQGLQKLSGYRRGVPHDVYTGAVVTASRLADCGPCLQLTARMGEAEGVEPELLRALVAGDEQALPEDVRLGVVLARSTMARDVSGEDAREEILRRWGRAALVSIAYGVVVAQSYPTLKYALGHGHHCVRVSVGGQTVDVAGEKVGVVDEKARFALQNA